MTTGWVQLPEHAITYCWTPEDYGKHRALSPYGELWNTACNRVGRPIPEGVSPGSPALVLCKECFPTPPKHLRAVEAG